MAAQNDFNIFGVQSNFNEPGGGGAPLPKPGPSKPGPRPRPKGIAADGSTDPKYVIWRDNNVLYNPNTGELFTLRGGVINLTIDVQALPMGGGSKGSTGATGPQGPIGPAGPSGLTDMNSAPLDFPNTLANTSSDLTIALPGAVDGDIVVLGVPSASVNPNSSYSAFVSAPDVVTVRFNNYSAGAINPAPGTFTVGVMQ